MKGLPRRERELFELLYAAELATASELHERMVDPPSYSAVRALLARLEGRRLIRRAARRSDTTAITYECVPQAGDVRASALSSMVKTFFAGSPAAAATALLGMDEPLTPDDIEAIQRIIDKHRDNRAGKGGDHG
jgi:predicted transcriptional regulator